LLISGARRTGPVRRLPGHAELTGKSEISFYSALR
jgi:hypothetical protein